MWPRRPHCATGRSISTLPSNPFSPGPARVLWNGLDQTGQPAAIGVYFARLTGRGIAATVKLALVR